MLSQRVKELKASPTLALGAKARQLKTQGNDVIALTLGEPDWDTFESVKQAGIDAINRGETKYTPDNGLPDLREAICRQTNQDLGTKYIPEEVTVSAGGKFVIFAAMQSLLDPGDEVICPAPYWVSYPEMAGLAQATTKVVVCGEKEKFRLTPEKLKNAITPKSKMLILNSPSNPTGLLYTKEELTALARIIREVPNLVVLSDDIYNRLVFADGAGEVAPHLLQVAPDLQNRCVLVNGLSKTYAMTGWRLGWALGPKEIIQAMSKYQSQSVSCAAAFTQFAALEAVKNTAADVKKSVEKLKVRRDFIVQAMKAIPDFSMIEPQGAFYVWLNVQKCLGKTWKGKPIHTADDWSQALLEDQMVLVVPGGSFGLDGYVRLSFAIEQSRMSQAIERMKKFVQSLV